MPQEPGVGDGAVLAHALIYGSVCSGIEAATVAWEPLGWKAAFYSEIDRFPRAVLQHHYPSVQNLGDMRNYERWPDANINVLVGGTPCQSFSVAGLRKGLADPRGSLTLTYLEIARRYRPSWLVWENVPGVLSDRSGAFGSFVGGLAALGYGWAYRILDAQHFGLAQRRERVFVVASSRGWASAAAALFERASLRGAPAPRRETGQEIANALTDRPDRGGTNSEGQRLIPVVTNTLTARMHKGVNSTLDEGQTIFPVAFHNRQDPDVSGDITHPLGAKYNGLGVATSVGVRRLTPRECERLQGFSDDYTAVPYRGMPAKDGPRYKALGNSMAVPVMRWIGERINLVESLQHTP